MTAVGRELLERLIERGTPPCASLYVRKGRGSTALRQDAIRLKNQSRRAVDALQETGLRGAEARQLLAPVEALIASPPRDDYTARGKAVFVCPDLFEHHLLPLRVPEVVVVGKRFHLKPLLALAAAPTCFYVLAISQQSVALFEADQNTMRQLDTRDVPSNLVEALRDDTDPRSIQYHTGTGSDGSPRRRAMFHSHDAGASSRKEQLAAYFRAVDRGIANLLVDRRIPLVIAAVDYLIPIFKQVSRYPVLAGSGIEGNPERLTPDELHSRAASLLGDRVSERQRRAASRYLSLSGTGTTGHDVREVVPAALDGRIETLFVGLQSHLWGRYDASSRHVSSAPEQRSGDEDLLDLAAIESYRRGTTVYLVDQGEVPGGVLVAAIYRY